MTNELYQQICERARIAGFIAPRREYAELIYNVIQDSKRKPEDFYDIARGTL